MMTKSETGKLGEEQVCTYLTDRGYTILARNYRIRGGEIDIIAENGDFIAFVEVKTRKPDSLVTGFEAVNKRKRGLIIKTAADYCCKHPTMLQPRFDVAQVIASGGRVLSIDYIQNAYDTTGYNYNF
jgi:putative endonuclease